MARRWTISPQVTEVVDDAMAEILRKKTPAERLSFVFQAHDMVREMVEARVRSLYPNADEVFIRNEILRRLCCDTK